MSGRKPRAGRVQAQSMVEFALAAPVFLLLVFGLVEGGRLLYTYDTLNHSAQEAGRLAVLQDTASVSAVKDRAVAAAEPLTISSSNVSVEVNDGATPFADRELGDRLSVTVQHTFVPVVAFVFGSDAGIDLTGETEIMVE